MMMCKTGTAEDPNGMNWAMKMMSTVFKMGKHIDELTSAVGNISQTDKLAAEKMKKIEDKVEKLAQGEENMKNKVNQIGTEMGELETRMNSLMEQFESRMMAQLEKKTAKMDTNQFGWKFHGHGFQGSSANQIITRNTSLEECFAICYWKRQDSGTDWDGLWWGRIDDGSTCCACNQSDRGHTELAAYVHFKMG